jgi:starvation-inducible DNA-binding protein
MTSEAKPKIGIAETDRSALADGLSGLLADTYTLYVMTQGFHWNVTGPHFHSLHEMFEEQYIQLRDAVDLVAERIRTIGMSAPGSFAQFLELGTVEDNQQPVDAIAMVKSAANGHETIVRQARPLVKLAEEAGDVATADLVIERIREHEQVAWMLRATAA